MSSKYILYSTHCPKCNVLSMKLKSRNIDFEETDDFTKPIELGYMSAPILYNGEKYYTFSEAMELIKNMG